MILALCLHCRVSIKPWRSDRTSTNKQSQWSMSDGQAMLEILCMGAHTRARVCVCVHVYFCYITCCWHVSRVVFFFFPLSCLSPPCWFIEVWLTFLFLNIQLCSGTKKLQIHKDTSVHKPSQKKTSSFHFGRAIHMSQCWPWISQNNMLTINKGALTSDILVNCLQSSFF